jgi:hypothetical protein
MSRVPLFWKLFIAVQCAGFLAILLCRVFFDSPAGPALWIIQFALLFPGDTWPAEWVTRPLWMGSTWIWVLAGAAAIVVANAICWYIVLSLVRLAVCTVKGLTKRWSEPPPGARSHFR